MPYVVANPLRASSRSADQAGSASIWPPDRKDPTSQDLTALKELLFYQSSFTPTSFIIFAYAGISFSICFCKSSPDRKPGLTPIDSNSFSTVGSCSTDVSSACSLSMAALGVLAGADKPYHVSNLYSLGMFDSRSTVCTGCASI